MHKRYKVQKLGIEEAVSHPIIGANVCEFAIACFAQARLLDAGYDMDKYACFVCGKPWTLKRAIARVVIFEPIDKGEDVGAMGALCEDCADKPDELLAAIKDNLPVVSVQVQAPSTETTQ